MLKSHVSTYQSMYFKVKDHNVGIIYESLEFINVILAYRGYRNCLCQHIQKLSPLEQY